MNTLIWGNFILTFATHSYFWLYIFNAIEICYRFDIY